MASKVGYYFWRRVVLVGKPGKEEKFVVKAHLQSKTKSFYKWIARAFIQNIEYALAHSRLDTVHTRPIKDSSCTY